GRGSTNAPRGDETAIMDGMRHRQRRKAAGESRREQRLPAPRRSSSWLGAEVRPGSTNRGIGTIGFPRNLGDLDVFHCRKALVPLSAGRTERGGTSDEESEQRIVLMRAGTVTHATRRRDGAAESRNRWSE